MKRLDISLPRFGFIVATRAALAAGLALLAGKKLNARDRRRAGRALLAIGALSTIPAILFVRLATTSRTAEEPL